MARRSLLTLVVCLYTTISGAGQDIIYYKFESGGGDTVVNYGDASAGAARLGTIVTSSSVSSSQAWGVGKFGSGGLAAGPSSATFGAEVNTGWNNVVGFGVDVTIAFFFRAVHPVPLNSGAPFCGPASGGPGIFMGISTAPSAFGRVSVSWQPGGGNSSSANLPQDLLTPAFSNSLKKERTVQ